ncbi:hypothetical protein Ms3S1_21770 [Methylosinus sp. 3S-1]
MAFVQKMQHLGARMLELMLEQRNARLDRAAILGGRELRRDGRGARVRRRRGKLLALRRGPEPALAAAGDG